MKKHAVVLAQIIAIT